MLDLESSICVAALLLHGCGVRILLVTRVVGQEELEVTGLEELEVAGCESDCFGVRVWGVQVVGFGKDFMLGIRELRLS